MFDYKQLVREHDTEIAKLQHKIADLECKLQFLMEKLGMNK